MEIQIKKAVKAGSSSAVILPRSWLNKEIRVELIKKAPETMLSDVLSILKRYINLSSISSWKLCQRRGGQKQRYRFTSNHK